MSDTEKRMIPVSTICRKRGVVKASLKDWKPRFAELESKAHEPSTSSHAYKLAVSWSRWTSIIDVFPDNDTPDENIAKEREELDQHDSNITYISLRLEELMRECSAKPETALHKIASRSFDESERRPQAQMLGQLPIDTRSRIWISQCWLCRTPSSQVW